MHTELFTRWLERLGTVSLQAGVLVLLVLLVQWLGRNRLTPRWRHALWFVVVVRLLVPVSIPSPTSLYNLLPNQVLITRSRVETPRAPSTRPGQSVPTRVGQEPIPVDPSPQTVSSPAASLEPALFTPAPTKATVTGTVSASLILGAIWLLGAGVLLTMVVIGTRLTNRRLREATEVTDAATLEQLGQCERQMGVQRPLPLFTTPAVASPVLHGLWRPRLLLPQGFLREFSRAEVGFVFLHELGHVKRRDIAINWLLTGLQIVHWFNPLVWWGFARMRRDRELACDALALEASGEDQRHAYGETILRLLQRLSTPTTVPGLVGLLEDRAQLKERIRAIAQFRAGKRGTWLAASLLVSLAVVALTDALELPGVDFASPAILANAAEQAEGAASPASDMPSPVATTDIGGVVVSSEDRPIVGATVTAYWTSQFGQRGGDLKQDATGRRFKATTDRGGRWSVRDFPNEWPAIVLAVEHPGYVSRPWLPMPADAFRQLKAGGLEIRMQKGVRVEGKVIDENRRPVVGGIVEVVNRDPSQGTRVAQTDAQGRFTFRTTLKGDLVLQASTLGHAPGRARVTLDAGSDRSGITIKLRPRMEDSARVVDETGAPMVDAYVTLLSTSVDQRRTSVDRTLTGDLEGWFSWERQWKSSRPDFLLIERAGYARTLQRIATLPENRTVALRRPQRREIHVIDAQTGKSVNGVAFVNRPALELKTVTFEPAFLAGDSHPRLQFCRPPLLDGRYTNICDAEWLTIMDVSAFGYADRTMAFPEARDGVVRVEVRLQPTGLDPD